MSLEDMSAKFNYSLTRHGRDKVGELKLGAKKGRPAASEGINDAQHDAVDEMADGTGDGTGDRTGDVTEEYGKED
jgi:hypothetical protein